MTEPTTLDSLVHVTLSHPKKNFGHEIRHNYKLVSLSKEKLVVTFKVGPESLNLMGNLHGSAFALMADELSTLAIFAADKTIRPSVTVNLMVNCLVSVPNGSTLTIESFADKIGKNIAFCTVNFYNAEGVLVADAKHTKAMLAKPML